MSNDKDKRFFRIVTALWALSMVFILSACDPTNRLNVFSTPIPREPLKLEDPAPIKMEPVQWTVITRENSDEVFDRLVELGIDPALFALTDTQFENLAVNLATMRSYMVIQREILKQYRLYYETE